jgi:hypothetical protein
MRAVVLQSNYLPWKGYFDLIQNADVFVFYDEVQYTKNDWRNRNRICSKNGVHWLTIPIGHEAVKGTISEAGFASRAWQEQHFKSLYFSYRPAPFFSQIEPLLVDVYKRHEWRTLSDVNRYCIESMSRMLGLATTFINSKELNLTGDRVHRLVSVLRQLGASEYLTGPSARSYLSGCEGLFEEAGVRLRFKSYVGYPEYRQLSEPFEHAVSVIDLLANVELGECRHYITAGQQFDDSNSIQ